METKESRINWDFEVVWNKGYCGYMNPEGKMITPIKYDEVEYFSDGLAPVKLNGKWGFIDMQGNEVIPTQYDDYRDYNEGLAAVKMHDGKWGYINKTGHVVIPSKYRDCEPFFEGLAQVLEGAYSGFIDQLGNVVIPIIYDSAGYFQEGLVPVELKDKFGYLDKEGNAVINFQFDEAEEFCDGKALVFLGENSFYIDKQGNTIKELSDKETFEETFEENETVIENRNFIEQLIENNEIYDFYFNPYDNLPKKIYHVPNESGIFLVFCNEKSGVKLSITERTKLKFRINKENYILCDYGRSAGNGGQGVQGRLRNTANFGLLRAKFWNLFMEHNCINELYVCALLAENPEQVKNQITQSLRWKPLMQLKDRTSFNKF